MGASNFYFAFKIRIQGISYGTSNITIYIINSELQFLTARFLCDCMLSSIKLQIASNIFQVYLSDIGY